MFFRTGYDFGIYIRYSYFISGFFLHGILLVTIHCISGYQPIRVSYRYS